MRWSTHAPAVALWTHVLVTPEVHRVRGRDVGPVVGLRGVSVALRRLARREFGATDFWNRDALVALAGRVLGLPACVGDG